MDKRERSEIFNRRLAQSMETAGITKSALARAVKADRSTIGQLLSDSFPRLPNGQLVADLASCLNVSTDWLLGLTNRPEVPGDILAAAMAHSPAERSAADEQLLEWHDESAGYKVRHVPATLPDILKTDRILEWEYSRVKQKSFAQAIAATHRHFSWLESGKSDYEISIPMHELQAFAKGIGYYDGLSRQTRADQLEFIACICEKHFPRLRLFLFDAHSVFSAPVTIFGPHLAVIYVGQIYLAFREAARVRTLTDHFDWLVREAVVDARHVSNHVRGMIE